MASGASCGPSRGSVVRIGGSGIVCLMAGITSCGRACKDIVDVAEDAGNSCMRASERERCVVVIERCSRPVSCCVACIASRGKSSGGVIGIGGAVPIGQMASITCCGQCGVVVVYMATGARCVYVGSG
jgi:hypothetical protein